MALALALAVVSSIGPASPSRPQLYASIYVTARWARHLWFALAALGAAACLVVPALAPWLLRVRPAAPPTRARAALDTVAALALAAVAAALLALDLRATTLFVHDEALGFFAVADVCARGVRCPLVGQPMLYGIHLGPAFYQVLALVHLADDPRVAFFVLLRVQLVAAAVLLGLAARRALGRGPWGAVAGASLYFSETFRPQLALLEHATLAVLPGAGFVYAALSFARHQRARDFTVAALCLGVAVQLHGILFPLAPALALLGLLGRAPRRAWPTAALGWAALFLPWLIYEARTRAHDLTHTFGFTGALGLGGGGGSFDRAAMLDRELWPMAALGLLAAAALAARRRAPPPDRRAAAGVVVLGLTALATCWLGRAGWSPRYSLLLHLALAPALAAAPFALWRLALAARDRLAAASGHRWLSHGVLLPAAIALAWLLAPMAQRAQRQLRQQSQEAGLFGLRPMPSTSGPLTYLQQKRLGALLAARGFGPVALDQNLHGAVWDRQYGAGWFDDAPRAAPPGPPRHALLLRGCVPPPGPFVVLPRPSAEPPDGVTVALYEPRLRALSAELDGARWPGPAVLPMLSRPTGYLFLDPLDALDTIGRARPLFRPTPEARALIDRWLRPGPGALRVQAVLGAGADERMLAVAHDTHLPVTVRVAGVELRAAEREPSGRRSIEHAYYRVGRAADDLAVEVTVARPDGAPPPHLELYETPYPRCRP